jgi:hypothetical protein
MRIRSIRPEFWSSEDIAALDWHTRLIYIGLWSYVDDNGVGRDNELLITAALFPLSEDSRGDSRRVAAGIRDLAAAGQIARYAVDGKRYLHVVSWTKHQRTDNAGKHRYPLPTCDDAVPAPVSEVDSPRSAASRGDSLLGEGEKGRRGEGLKTCPPAPPSGSADDPIGFPEFWFTWPGTQSKADAKRAYAKALRKCPRHELLEAAVRFRDDPNRTAKNTPYAATWLNAERWEDGPLPDRSGSDRPNQTARATGWITTGTDLMDLYPDEPKEIGR